jgi:homoserine O-succinyltransferase
MPLTFQTFLPSLSGLPSVSVEAPGSSPDWREAGGPQVLNLGFVNLMPDASLHSVELRFMRLVGMAARELTIRVTFLHLGEYPHQAGSAPHLKRHYRQFDPGCEPLDALIITGTVPTASRIEDEPVWPALRRLIDWAADHVGSTFCSCLAAHAVGAHLYGVRRRRLAQKRWGVFPHRVVDRGNPLVQDAGAEMLVPHSRYFEVTEDDVVRAGLKLVVTSAEAGPHLFTSADGIRFVFSQGHPEYGRRTLLREFLRDMSVPCERDAAAFPFPVSYFPPEVAEGFCAPEHLRADGTLSSERRSQLEAIGTDIDFTWEHDAVAVLASWLREVAFLAALGPSLRPVRDRTQA